MGVLANNPKVYDLVASSVQVEKIATGFTFTEGPIWHPDGYLLFSDMPADVRRKWTEAEDRRGAEAGEQVQRDDARRRPEPDRLRALDEPRRARRPEPGRYGGQPRGDRLALRRCELNSPNDVVVKSTDRSTSPTDIQADGRLRQPAGTADGRPGRVPDPAGRGSSASPTTTSSRTGSVSRRTSRPSTSTTRASCTSAATP